MPWSIVFEVSDESAFLDASSTGGREAEGGEGGGGGGGARTVPVGIVEISDQQTRFVAITDRKKLAAAVVAGVSLGILLGWRKRR